MSESEREIEPSPEFPESQEILKTEQALDEALLLADMAAITREAPQVRLYGETAVVTGIVHIQGYRAGSTGQQNTNRYLRVHVRRKGRWQLVAHRQRGSLLLEVRRRWPLFCLQDIGKICTSGTS